MKQTRKKHNAQRGVQSEGGVGGGQGDRTIPELASEFGVHPNGIYTGRSSCWTGRRAFSKAAVARAHVGERGVSKSVVLLTGDRGFESVSLQRRVTCEPDFLDQGRSGPSYIGAEKSGSSLSARQGGQGSALPPSGNPVTQR